SRKTPLQQYCRRTVACRVIKSGPCCKPAFIRRASSYTIRMQCSRWSLACSSGQAAVTSRRHAPRSLLLRFESTDQALDALQLAARVLLMSRFGRQRHGARGHGGGAAGHLRGGVQGGRRGARGHAVRLQVDGTSPHCRHGGGEQRAVGHAGQGVRAVPETRAHGVEERVTVNRGGGRGGGGRCGCHVRVGVGKEASEGGHCQALDGEDDVESEIFRTTVQKAVCKPTVQANAH
ncbi:hypothetical protein AOLI_G00266310, partial [Acnodon oligacanthus]